MNMVLDTTGEGNSSTNGNVEQCWKTNERFCVDNRPIKITIIDMSISIHWHCTQHQMIWSKSCHKGVVTTLTSSWCTQ